MTAIAAAGRQPPKRGVQLDHFQAPADAREDGKINRLARRIRSAQTKLLYTEAPKVLNAALGLT